MEGTYREGHHCVLVNVKIHSYIKELARALTLSKLSHIAITIFSNVHKFED